MPRRNDTSVVSKTLYIKSQQNKQHLFPMPLSIIKQPSPKKIQRFILRIGSSKPKSQFNLLYKIAIKQNKRNESELLKNIHLEECPLNVMRLNFENTRVRSRQYITHKTNVTMNNNKRENNENKTIRKSKVVEHKIKQEIAILIVYMGAYPCQLPIKTRTPACKQSISLLQCFC